MSENISDIEKHFEFRKTFRISDVGKHFEFRMSEFEFKSADYISDFGCRNSNLRAQITFRILLSELLL